MSNYHANWPAPSNVSALTTSRSNGYSQSPFHSNNLAYHVGDDENAVRENRTKLSQNLQLPGEPEWLEQIHSNICVVVEEDSNRRADAAITRHKNRTLAIMTADCLPILLCDKKGNEIAAIHSGWRGLSNGIIENTLSKMQSKPDSILAWIGPAICQSCFEVGEEVLDIFQNRYHFAKASFKKKSEEKWLANLAQLAEQALLYNGVKSVSLSNLCTYENKNDFYSYRRDAQTGRIATLIWLNATN